jgi:hypothetical protein
LGQSREDNQERTKERTIKRGQSREEKREDNQERIIKRGKKRGQSRENKREDNQERTFVLSFVLS